MLTAVVPRSAKRRSAASTIRSLVGTAVVPGAALTPPTYLNARSSARPTTLFWRPRVGQSASGGRQNGEEGGRTATATLDRTTRNGRLAVRSALGAVLVGALFVGVLPQLA